jgi:hypothetical protein
MTTDPVHDALAPEATIEPGPAFTASVMAAVRRDAALPPIGFPWRRFALGLTASIATPLLVALTGVPAPTPEEIAPLAWTAIALTASWLCYAAARRLGRTAP